MRKFSSYGPVDRDIHYHAPREELIESAYIQLVGEHPEKGGHYITVWAPRQAGKTWIMQQTLRRIREQGDFEVGIISMQSARKIGSEERILELFVRRLREWFERELPDIRTWDMLRSVFSEPFFSKPVILIIDEFDALREDFINSFANEFRDMHIMRKNETEKPSGEKSCLLHGLALIGVRSVLGIENVSGSPFNIQRSLRIPNLTYDEVGKMFGWYEKESGQKVEPDVVEKLFYETRGQPGLVSWFGELLTETYNKTPEKPVTMRHFDYAFRMAVKALPNNNIINIISKAKEEPCRETVLKFFRTDQKTGFAFDDPLLNFLYMNGVIDTEETDDDLYVRFSSPFVQKRLFNYFSRELFPEVGRVTELFEDLSDTLTTDGLHVGSLVRRYEKYLRKNRDWLLRDAPRRKDLRVFEAVYHFNLYEYLRRFLGNKNARVWPEFPTGNGTIDLIINYEGTRYGLELKSYSDERAYRESLGQAARYGKSLGLSVIWLVVFVEHIPDEYRKKYETDHIDGETGVTVRPVFAATGG